MNVRDFLAWDRRWQVSSVAAAVVLVAVIIWALPSGGVPTTPAGAGLPGRPTEAAKPVPSGKPVVPSRVTVRSRPPARMFAGPESALGMLIRVCEGDNCTALPQGNPSTIASKSGRVLTFTLAERPSQAWVEIRGLPSGAPARLTLQPGSLMSYPGHVAPGRYVITLNAKFAKTEARWMFGLKVAR